MAKTSRCPRCAKENDAGFTFCLDCGEALLVERPPATTEPLCASCGARLEPRSRFCGACGKPAGASPATPRRGGELAVRGASAAGARTTAAPPPSSAVRIRLALIRSDGLPGQVFSVEREEAICGRIEGEIRLADDPTVSPRHARFTVAGGIVRVEDLGSVNGTFLRLREPRRLGVGEELRVGRQLLRLEPLRRPALGDEQGVRAWGTNDPGYVHRLSQILEGGGLGEIFPLREGDNAIGREAGEVTFPSDRYVSARHSRIVVSGGEITLADAGSSNGTYVKIAAEELSPGDEILVGAQLLRVE